MNNPGRIVGQATSRHVCAILTNSSFQSHISVHACTPPSSEFTPSTPASVSYTVTDSRVLSPRGARELEEKVFFQHERVPRPLLNLTERSSRSCPAQTRAPGDPREERGYSCVHQRRHELTGSYTYLDPVGSAALVSPHILSHSSLHTFHFYQHDHYGLPHLQVTLSATALTADAEPLRLSSSPTRSRRMARLHGVHRRSNWRARTLWRFQDESRCRCARVGGSKEPGRTGDHAWWSRARGCTL